MPGNNAAQLQPSKFILLILQVVAISVIIEVRREHIYAGISASKGVETTQYKNAQSSLMLWCVISLICLVFEFLIIFSGTTLFNDSYNIITITWHIVGLFFSYMFISGQAHYLNMRALCVVSSILPLGFEIMSCAYSKMNYRKQFKC